MHAQVMAGVGALIVGVVAGAFFRLLGIPLPWTLGPLVAAACISMVGGVWLMPSPVRNVARPVVGILAGGAFTPEVVASINEWWGAIVFVGIYTVTVTTIGWFFFRKLCRLDPVTSYFASTPGGLGELTLLGGELGGNVRTLVTVHAVRLIVVVATIPFIIQAIIGSEVSLSGLGNYPGNSQNATLLDWLILATCGVASYILARYIKITGGVMIIAIFLSAVVHGTGLTHVMPPDWLMILVQIVIGSVAGARFAGLRWKEARGTVVQAVVWTGVLLLTAVGFAWAGARFFDKPFAALVLATSPGGFAEMTIISIAIGLETAFVVTCQAFRSIFVVAVSPIVFQLMGVSAPKKSSEKQPPDGGG